MTAKVLLVLSLALIPVATAIATPPRIAVGDFTVTSDDPRLKYVGKGLAEMVAADLAQSKDVLLIDREKRAALLGELEFALSGAADEKSQLEAGKLLSADYLLFGEIVDMATSVLVSCTLVKVETGQVVWTDKSLGALSDYDGLSRKLANSALQGLRGGTPAMALAPPPKPTRPASAEKRLEAIFAFSGAVNALDKQDKVEAKKQIEVAVEIDPGNAAVAAYAAKLSGLSPRFLVELDTYAPAYNPAVLGFIDKAAAYTWSSSAKPVGSDVGQYDSLYFDTPRGSIMYKESNNSQKVGIQIPVASRTGLMAEFNSIGETGNIGSNGTSFDITEQIPGTGEVNLDQGFLGGWIGVGYRLMPNLSLGIAGNVSYFEAAREETVPTWQDLFPDAQKAYFGAAGGIAYQGPGGRISGDLELVWSQQPEFYFLSPEGGVGPGYPGEIIESSPPLIASTGVTAGFFDQRLFANLRSISEIGVDDRGYFAERAIPGLEWWPLKWIAVRAAYEFSYISVSKGAYTGGANTSSGSGFMGGATITLWGFELNANYINRYRPFRKLNGAGHQDQVFLIGLSYTGLIKRR